MVPHVQLGTWYPAHLGMPAAVQAQATLVVGAINQAIGVRFPGVTWIPRLATKSPLTQMFLLLLT